MMRPPQIHGALLEEIVLKLLSLAGYRQVTVGEEGTSRGVGAGLEVQGRGAPHQIDALVTPIHAHSFIYTIRLIVETKCESKAVGVDVVRNLVGTLLDLNQNFITWESDGTALSMQQFNYHGALFAANGYSERAEQYALAHQIFLIDYSNLSLLRPVIDALVSLDLNDFGIGEDGGAQFSMTSLRESFDRVIRMKGDIAPDEVFAETGLAKVRERLLPALEDLKGSYYGMIQGIYPVHLISKRPISNSLILRQGAIPCEIRVSQDNRIWAFEPSEIDPASDDFFHLEFSLPVIIADVLGSRLREAGRRVPEWLQVANLKREFLRYIDISTLIDGRMVGFKLLLDENWLDQYVEERQR